MSEKMKSGKQKIFLSYQGYSKEIDMKLECDDMKNMTESLEEFLYGIKDFLKAIGYREKVLDKHIIPEIFDE